MIRLVKQPYLDRQKYDLCIKLDASSLIYGNSWYLDTVSHHWDVLVWNDYDAVMPLPGKRKWGLGYFYRPYGIQQLGIFSKKSVGEELVRKFLMAVTEHCSLAEIYLNAGQSIPNIKGKPWQLSLQRNLIVRLDRTYSDLYEGYSKNLKRNLRKADNNNWHIFEHDSPEKILEHFRANKGNELELDPLFYKDMLQLMYRCLHKGCGHLWTLYGEGNKLLAGIFIMEFRDRLTLLFSSASPEGKEKAAMPFLLNEYLIHQSEKYRYFDFEGSNDPGLARFYSSFGAEEENYYFFKYNGLPRIIKWLK